MKKPKCKYCNDTGLDPKSYDEHIQSNGFWFANPCSHCEKGKEWKRIMGKKAQPSREKANQHERRVKKESKNTFRID